MDADDVLARLRDELPAAAFPDPAPFLTEPRGRFRGQGQVVAPGSRDEVSATLRLCHDASVPVVPYGGGTGLVGGQIKPSDTPPVVLSLHRMAGIRAVGADVIEAQAGAVLANIQAAAEAQDRLFPLSLASEGSAQIGGLLATNAGGVNVLRYGNARALCLGVEAVLADGSVYRGLSGLRKDNTGYDLRDLLIGSEGTLGIITAASLRLFPRPRAVGTALLAVESPEAALDLLARAQARVGEAVSAFELISAQGVAFLREVGPEVAMPLDPVPDWMVLIELGLPEGLAPDAVLEALFAEAVEAGLCDDGVIAQSEAQRQAIWTLRENIPAANRRVGAVASHDIALPVARVPDFIARAPAIVAAIAPLRINCFGHLGDGNLHYNVFPRVGEERTVYDPVRAEVSRAIHDLVMQMGGSFSAEHGVGRLKAGDLERYGDPVKLAMMRAIKTALDPKGILNPGAVLQSPS